MAEDWKSVTTELLGFLLREIDLAREERMRPDGGQRAGLPRGLRLLGPVSALEELKRTVQAIADAHEKSARSEASGARLAWRPYVAGDPAPLTPDGEYTDRVVFVYRDQFGIDIACGDYETTGIVDDEGKFREPKNILGWIAQSELPALPGAHHE